MYKLDDKKNYNLICTEADIAECVSLIRQASIIAFDTETAGLNVRKDKVIGYSFSTEIGNGYYLPLLQWDGTTLVKCNLFSNAAIILKELQNKKLIMHNASFDARIVFNNLDIDLLDSLHSDTVLMRHTLQEEGPFGLKDIAIELADKIGLDGQDLANQEQVMLEANVKSKGGSWKKSNKEIYKADTNILAAYAAADTDMTLRLYYYFEDRLVEESLHDFFYKDEVMPLYKHVTIIMEAMGIDMDVPNLIKYNNEISKEIKNAEKFVVDKILNSKYGLEFIDKLCEDYQVSNKGSFAQQLCKYFDLPIPMSDSGKYSLTKNTLGLLPDSNIKSFLVTGQQELLETSDILQIKKALLYKDEPRIVNISSKKQLGILAFQVMGLEPIAKTEKGSPQFNEDFLETIKEDWAKELRVYNKLCKIKSSYYDRFLEEQEDGKFYPTFKQFATTSGRYGSNLQQLSRPIDEGSDDPRVVKYVNTLRELFVAPHGYVFIDDDYESLEPRVFADDAADQALIDIFELGEDFYSKVAIQAENIENVSAHKNHPDFLKNKLPNVRQRAKAYSLGIRYGMKSGKLSMSLNISKEEAEDIISGYFKAFPNLKNKMDYYLKEAKTKGFVKSKYGRVRHLPKVKEIYSKYKDDLLDYGKMMNISRKTYKPLEELKELKREYNNLLNNALNFPIQSAASSLVNRAAVAMSIQFKEQDLDAWVCLQIHDQLLITCNKNCIDKVKYIVQDCMENTNKLSMKLVAKPEIATNLRNGH